MPQTFKARVFQMRIDDFVVFVDNRIKLVLYLFYFCTGLRELLFVAVVLAHKFHLFDFFQNQSVHCLVFQVHLFENVEQKAGLVVNPRVVVICVHDEFLF